MKKKCSSVLLRTGTDEYLSSIGLPCIRKYLAAINKRIVTFIILVVFASSNCYSQSVSINTDGTLADSSAILDVKSTTKGVLIPRLTKVQKDLIPSPAVGLLIYQTDNDNGFYYYNGTAWLLLLAVSVNSNNNTLTYTTRGF